MSLILDALRKSEAERRRGRMPDLHAELPPLVHATAPRKRAWSWWFAGLAVLMAAAALAWSQWAIRWPSAATAPAQARNVAIDPAPGTIVAPAVVANPTPTLPPTGVPVAPVPELLHPAPQAAAPQPAAPAIVREPVAEGPPPREASVPARAIAAEASIEATPSMPAPSTAAPAPAIGLPLPAAAAASGTVRLADLSPGEREQLPSLKISMHMWGPTPTERFAIIDGARVGQGDRVGDAVVEEILSDGVVLNWHGRRLSLPLR